MSTKLTKLCFLLLFFKLNFPISYVKNKLFMFPLSLFSASLSHFSLTSPYVSLFFSLSFLNNPGVCVREKEAGRMREGEKSFPIEFSIQRNTIQTKIYLHTISIPSHEHYYKHNINLMGSKYSPPTLCTSYLILICLWLKPKLRTLPYNVHYTPIT
jgi:hypothetical protein